MRNQGDVCCDLESPMGSALVEPCCEKSSSDEIGKIREINIRQVNYGYVVNVGCHTFAIESVARLSEMLNKYLLQPNATEKLWYDGTLFK